MIQRHLNQRQISVSNATDIGRWRVTTAARVFALATVLGLAVSTGRFSESSVDFLTFCALAAVMSLPIPTRGLTAGMPVAEGAIGALLLASTAEPGPLLVYLVVPPLVAGGLAGVWGAAFATAAECGALSFALLASNQGPSLVQSMDLMAPWILVGLGMGLLSAWMRTSDNGTSDDQAGYESAHRLLAQLRAVSRRLSSGLDTTTLAERMLAETVEALGSHRALLLTRADDSDLTPIAGMGLPFDRGVAEDQALKRTWTTKQAAYRVLENPGAYDYHRTVLPLLVGHRLIGVVVADSPALAPKPVLEQLQSHLKQQSLRLETALLFDEVRSSATMEERHRLAREIHDGVAQEIASLGYLVDELTATISTDEGRSVAQDLRRELSRVVSELRLSIFDLRSNVTPHAGLGFALSDYAREVGRRSGMTVHIALSEQPQRLQLHVETELLRIAQEAITNARKHSHARNLWITLNTESPVVILRIEDDGIGSAEVRDEHYGLHIMSERAERIGAEVAIGPRPHGGTSVTVTVWPTNTAPGVHRDHLSLAR